MSTSNCPGCELEIAGGTSRGATFPDGSFAWLCEPCSRSGAFLAKVRSLTWAEGKAYKAKLIAEGYSVSNWSGANDLKEAALQLVFGLLAAGVGIAIAASTKGRFLAVGGILVGGGYAVAGLIKTIGAAIAMITRPMRWNAALVKAGRAA